MRRTLTWGLVVALLLVLLVPLAGCQRKVKMTTGEIVICTEGEVLEDNTREIEVPQSQVGKYGVTTKVITCDQHSDIGKLYADAQDKIAKGDLEGARDSLAAVVERDPTYRKAKEQLDQIDKGTKPTADLDNGATADNSDDNGDAATPPATNDEPTGPVVSLITYVPDSIDGYAAQGILADAASLSRTYIPSNASANQLVIEVEQQVNAQAATAAQATIAGGYPDSRAEKTVNSKQVLVGAVGQYAVAVFTDGAITVTVELHATGASGADLINDALAVVDSITR